MHSPAPHRRNQRGIALFVVVVFVMLSMLLALWASRTALINEMVVGNDVDYQRAFEAAQALLQDAELDIRGQKADGSACTAASGLANGGSSANNVCRTDTAEKIPLEDTEADLLLANLELKTPQCSHALCAKRTGAQDFWNDATTLSNMESVGARYGQYTGAVTGSASQLANPILAETDSGKGGWYWIEMLKYLGGSADNAYKLIDDTTVATANVLPLNLSPNVVYRITALAHGRKPGTLVVLQQTWAKQAPPDSAE